MPVVFTGAVSHGPGITGRADLADPQAKERLYAAFARLREEMEMTRPDVLVVIAAEHFANFFMDNMPAYAVGIADYYDGPIEDEQWLGIDATRVPGDRDTAHALVTHLLEDVDLAYSEEWKFDHGVMVPLHFLTPDYDLPVIPININCQGPPLTPYARAYRFGRKLKAACDAHSKRIAVIATGGLSHWPATPDSGKINEAWDRDFLKRWCANDESALAAYKDEDVYLQAGQGGFEIRTFIAAAGVADGSKGRVYCYEPIPIFAVGCTVARFDLPA
jgi:2,3-dihydroxyphenylpropionate 1,2-dioxygenase